MSSAPRVSLWRSFRVRLVVLTIVVEALMLFLLVANSVRIINESLDAQTRIVVSDVGKLLNAALADRLFQRDYAAINDILSRQVAAADTDLAYAIVTDNDDRVYAYAGIERPERIVKRGKNEHAQGEAHARRALDLAGVAVGAVYFGLRLSRIEAARQAVLTEGSLIAVAEIILSAALLLVFGYLMTRHIDILRRSAQAYADGRYDHSVNIAARDEMGDLARIFNLMGSAVRDQINALEESRAQFRTISEWSYAWELWIAPSGNIKWVNDSVSRLTGYNPEDILAMHDFPAQIAIAQQRDLVTRAFHRALEGNTGETLDFRCLRKDGSAFWASAMWQPVYSASKEFLGLRASIIDVDARYRSEAALKSTVAELESVQKEQHRTLERSNRDQARMRSLLSAMSMGILFENAERRIDYCNPAFKRMWSIPDQDDITGQETRDVLLGSQNQWVRPDYFSKYVLQMPGTHAVSEQLEMELTDGRRVSQQTYPVADEDDRVLGRLWVFEDITHERQTADQLLYMAQHDALTGLYNRRQFTHELQRMETEFSRGGPPFALFFFDLDEFKYVNDTFGHSAGDAILVRVAGEISTYVRRNEILSRLGGDEFAILAPVSGTSDVGAFAERIVQSVAKLPFRFHSKNIRMTASIGIALLPEHASTAEELVSRADAAMYEAKRQGKNTWEIYRPDMQHARELEAQVTWSDRLEHALATDGLRLLFQGVFHAADASLAHSEALVRMVDVDDPERLIMPGNFIPAIERSGRILDLDRWVLETVVRELSSNPETAPIAVNVSGRSIDDPGLPKFIRALLRKYDVAPDRLFVELTETSAVSDLYDARRFIDELQRVGCRVYLDDFGAGFSSFSYLKHINADGVKIDGQFVRDLPSDNTNRVFVKSMVDIAKGLGKTTVAEFVETAETLEILNRYGVDLAQGYHLDRPHPGASRSQPR